MIVEVVFSRTHSQPCNPRCNNQCQSLMIGWYSYSYYLFETSANKSAVLQTESSVGPSGIDTRLVVTVHLIPLFINRALQILARRLGTTLVDPLAPQLACHLITLDKTQESVRFEYVKLPDASYQKLYFPF